MTTFPLFVTSPKGLEDLLAAELRQLGLADAKPGRAGARGSGSLTAAYRVCLWSRLANRVLLPLAEFAAPDAEALYAGTQNVAWAEHLAPEGSLVVDFHGTNAALRHTHFAALKIKDAVVDYFRSRHGARPRVDTAHPDLRLNAYLHRERVVLSLDLSGISLHRRGYRSEAGAAPLKENLAAAMLYKADWPELARQGGLLDPLCGAGTLPIEAALMAGDCAPGLGHADDFGLLRWRQHDAQAWRELLDEAEQRRAEGAAKIPRIVGYDATTASIHQAWDNARRAGMERRLHFERRALADLEAVPGIALIVANPPYGERLGEIATVQPLYTLLGEKLGRHFAGSRAVILAGNREQGKALGMRADKVNTVYNGALECKLVQCTISPSPLGGGVLSLSKQGVGEREKVLGYKAKTNSAPSPPAPLPEGEGRISAGAQMFANRLRKNLRKLRPWAEREGVSCYRVYDADLPEYNAAIDLYEQWVHVQEYAAPASIDPRKATQRLDDLVSALPQVLEIPRERVFVKVRQRQKGTAQYRKQGHCGEFHEVREGPAVLLVNFRDYLDTGLFLDHRPVRAMIQESARGKHFLNLFCYTASATVYAAYGGARSSTSVDLSPTYLDWARRNLARNGFSEAQHRCERADCRAWLEQNTRRYDLILLDPPTFSNSKRMPETLDIQRDHVALLRAALNALNLSGILLFSNNLRGFKLDYDALADLRITDLSTATVPPDFQRNPKIHQCWRIERG